MEWRESERMRDRERRRAETREKDVPEGNDNAFDSTLLKHETSDDVYRGNHFDVGSHGEPQLRKRGTSIEEIKTPLDDMIEVQPSLGTSMVQRTSIDREPLQKLRRHQPKIFTSKRMSTCIIASESTRIICALIIAFLAVLSYVDYPLFGRNIVKSESVVASRPLYILLLTDVTIVLVLLHFEKLRGPEEAEEEEVAPPKDRDNWAEAEKVLERGLVVYQATRAIFIDCSVYLVVVICGLSLV